MNNEQRHKIIFFDGVCALCNGSMKFVIKRDKNRVFKYAPLQGKTANKKLNSLFDLKYPSSIVLLNGDIIYTKSTAILKIVKELPVPWNTLIVFWIIPRPVRDWLYSVVAKYRYSVFGKYDTCTIPTAEEQDLFLE